MEKQKRSIDFDRLVDVSDCNTLEQIEARRVALLDEQARIIENSHVARSELAAALASFKSGGRGKSFGWRKQRADIATQSKLDSMDINAALAELKAKARMLVHSKPACAPTGKFKLRRIAFHFLAIAERELGEDEFRDILQRATIAVANDLPIQSAVLSAIGDEVESQP